ncbi:hypothetical protein LC55x_0833 [Lysobacter capsici]|nr:hypothetical protein LC55x_0833 [Lysobacter capsici]
MRPFVSRFYACHQSNKKKPPAMSWRLFSLLRSPRAQECVDDMSGRSVIEAPATEIS